MRSFLVSTLSFLCLAAWAPMTPTPQERDRGKISDPYKWNLADIYPSDAAWKEAKQKFANELLGLEKYQGTLDKSADRLLGCLDLVGHLNKEFARLFTYANLRLDQDMRVPSSAALQQELNQLGAALGEKAAFIEPEILAIDPAKVQSFLKSDERRDTYRHYVDDILRRHAHTGTEGEEKIIADAELMAAAPSGIRDLLRAVRAVHGENEPPGGRHGEDRGPEEVAAHSSRRFWAFFSVNVRDTKITSPPTVTRIVSAGCRWRYTDASERPKASHPPSVRLMQSPLATRGCWPSSAGCLDQAHETNPMVS